MNIPPSPHFTTISLASATNQRRSQLPQSLGGPWSERGYGLQTILGIPFDFGPEANPNVILLADEPVELAIDGLQASYLLFVHVVEDRKTNYLDGLADFAVDGNELGDHVADYALVYNEGEEDVTPIRRRFAIQQPHIGWGASPFEAQPAGDPGVKPTVSEALQNGQMPQIGYGRGETRHETPRNDPPAQLWIYALPNPHPDRPIRALRLVPRAERAAIFAISATQLEAHPLRPGTRKKLRLALPPGLSVNATGDLDEIAIDLGTVISARSALDYDNERWLGDEPNVQPAPADDAVIVEYSAHPHARLYVGKGESRRTYDLADLKEEEVVEVAPAERPVTIRVVEKGSNRPVPVRIHLHGAAGEYLPPKNHHRRVNGYWFEDNYGEFVNGANGYSYIDGQCEVDLPLGEVFVEVTRGYEVKPLRTQFTVSEETDEITLEIERVLDWRRAGWVTADTHVHFLSPQTALLEGQAEDVHVVNLLASQWGEMFSNVTDFDGRSTIGAADFGGDGEFLVRVGTENRMQVLGHVSLLGYQGEMILPLCTGGPSESAIGDPQEVLMAEWAQRCIEQGGLVVMPHGPNPQCERAADIVLGVIHAIEMMTFNPFDNQINPYGIADWYRYLNLGYHIPVVGGSDKMAASALLGGIRTYAHLGERAFTYENWMEAVRGGNTFVTVGPLAEITVEGKHPGERLDLPAGGGTVDVSWRVESAGMPIDGVEIVHGGLTAESHTVDKSLSASGSTSLRIDESSWIALRVRGSYRGESGEIAAHTSAVQIVVDGAPLFSAPDAAAVLDQIGGAIAYLDVLAPRADVGRLKQMRAVLEGAYDRLHRRMHAQGIYHDHIVSV